MIKEAVADHMLVIHGTDCRFELKSTPCFADIFR